MGTTLTRPRHQPVIPTAERSSTRSSCHQSVTAHRVLLEARVSSLRAAPGCGSCGFYFWGADSTASQHVRCTLLTPGPSPTVPSVTTPTFLSCNPPAGTQSSFHSSKAELCLHLISVPKPVYYTPAAVLLIFKFKLEENSALLLEIT